MVLSSQQGCYLGFLVQFPRLSNITLQLCIQEHVVCPCLEHICVYLFVHLQSVSEFQKSMFFFTALGIPVAMVSSALKSNERRLELALQLCLTQQLHHNLCVNKAYHAASMLGGGYNTMLFQKLLQVMRIHF